MRYFLVFVVALAVVWPRFALAQQAERRDLTAADVRKSIDRGVAYLKQRQRPDGTWDEWISQRGGTTCLVVLAMLNAGVPVEDKHVQAGLRVIRSLPPVANYTVALQTMVLCRACPEELLTIRRNAQWFENTQTNQGGRLGAWSYPADLGDAGAKLGGDNSNAQFALLALYEAEQLGVEVGENTWKRAKAYWEDCQNPDGSWGYLKGIGGTGSMTAAGIASMVIVNDRIGQGNARVVGDHVQCCAGGDASNERVELAINWLAKNFSVEANPPTSGLMGGQRSRLWLYYYLYGLERVGRMTNRRFIGNHDWYREGAQFLVRQQDAMSGYWKGIGQAEQDEVISTSLAVLFLSKGRWPILMAKLRLPELDWEQHRNDVGNLTRYVERRWRRDMTWQTFDLKSATIDDLLQAPVLYLCGSKSPLPSDPAAQNELAGKLRGYLDRGGFIFAEANCGMGGFEQGFRKLLEKAMPEKEYRLRLLPPEHPIWSAEEPIKPAQARPLYGVDFGCRTSVIFAPLDPAEAPRPSLSCLWELSRSGRGQKFSDSVKSQVDAAMATGINVLAYATNRELKDKDPGASRTAKKPALEPVGERNRLRLATLRHPGGCNVTPRALTNLLAAGRDQLNLRVRADSELIDIGDDAIFDYPMVFMHGRSGFRLTDSERAQLKKYLERGGMIFADAICASSTFTESFRREMAVILPQKPLKAITTADPILTNKYGGFDLAKVKRREMAARSPGEPIKTTTREGPPKLESIVLGGRHAVVFSEFDVSCALEKQDSVECAGYVREDAARIALNVLLYALYE